VRRLSYCGSKIYKCFDAEHVVPRQAYPATPTRPDHYHKPQNHAGQTIHPFAPNPHPDSLAQTTPRVRMCC